MVDTLPVGKTLKGAWVVQEPAGGTGEDAVMFNIPLPSAPIKHIIQAGVAPPAGCSGNVLNPGASPGHLCIFVGWRSGVTNLSGAYNPEDGSNLVVGSKFGVVVYANSAGTWEMAGTYAVTAAAVTPTASVASAASQSLGSQ
jgi:hypothetical protein